MRNIKNYKERFYSLMESTMGDVKPLISEDLQSDKVIKPKNDMIKFTYSTFKFEELQGLNVSVNGDGYNLTLPKKEYKEGEHIHIKGDFITKENSNWNPNNNLDISSKETELNIKFHNKKAKENHLYIAEIRGDRNQGEVYFSFPLPKSQSEFDDNQPFGFYVTVPCKNVEEKKLKISVEVPSGSKIVKK